MLPSAPAFCTCCPPFLLAQEGSRLCDTLHCNSNRGTPPCSTDPLEMPQEGSLVRDALLRMRADEA